MGQVPLNMDYKKANSTTHMEYITVMLDKYGHLRPLENIISPLFILVHL